MKWIADRIELRSVDSLIPYARNARTHSDEQVAQIAASIAEFGFTNPILAGSDGVIVAGHGRLMAARKLGLEEVPVVVLDHLTPTQRRALVLADNRIAEQAGWDAELLRIELDELEAADFDIESLGITSSLPIEITEEIEGDDGDDETIDGGEPSSSDDGKMLYPVVVNFTLAESKVLTKMKSEYGVRTISQLVYRIVSEFIEAK